MKTYIFNIWTSSVMVSTCSIWMSLSLPGSVGSRCLKMKHLKNVNKPWHGFRRHKKVVGVRAKKLISKKYARYLLSKILPWVIKIQSRKCNKKLSRSYLIPCAPRHFRLYKYRANFKRQSNWLHELFHENTLGDDGCCFIAWMMVHVWMMVRVSYDSVLREWN